MFASKVSREPATQPKSKTPLKPGAGSTAPAGRSLTRSPGPGSLMPVGAGATTATRLGVDLARVRIHADDEGDRLSRKASADAVALGDDIYFRKGHYAPSSAAGQHLLSHELAHVAQFQRGVLHGPESELERQAERASRGADAFAAGMGFGRSFAPRLLRQASARCTGIVVRLPHTVVLNGTAGPITGEVTFDEDVKAGSYTVRLDKATGQLEVQGVGTENQRLFSISVQVKGTGAQIKSAGDRYQSYIDSIGVDPVMMTVLGSAGAGGTGAGKGGGKGGEKDGAGGSAGSTKAGGAKPGSTGTAPVHKGEPGGTGAAAAQGAGSVQVNITDPKQIDELRRKGLLDDSVADDIKNRSAQQQPLTFEEVMALYKAISETMVLKQPGKDQKDSKDQQQDSWIDVAKFIQANREQFTGRQSTGDSGLTLAEMKEILKKYHAYVGVEKTTDSADKPASTATPQEKIDRFDPEKRQSWNALSEADKEIWRSYVRLYGEPANDDPSADLSMTAARKMSLALHMSPRFISPGFREGFEQLVNDPFFQVGVMAGITLYVGAWLAPEPLFSKATAATITIALLTFFTVSEIRNFAIAWMNLGDESEAAKDFGSLQDAAEHFGKAMGGILVRVMVTLGMMLAGKLLPSPATFEGPGGTGGGAAPEPNMGGLRPAPAGGGGGAAVANAPAATAIKVLADGTILIVGPGVAAAPLHAAMMQGGGGGGGTPPSGGSGPSGAGGGSPASQPPKTTQDVFAELDAELKGVPEGQGDLKGTSPDPKKFASQKPLDPSTVDQSIKSPKTGVVRESAGAKIVQNDEPLGSAQTNRSINTGIRSGIAEGEHYKLALESGEIGLQRPGGANVPGPDSITAAGDGSEVFVNDPKNTVVGKHPVAKGPGVKPEWMKEVESAVSPGRLKLGDPALEAKIRQAVADGKVRVRQINVDYSPEGGGSMKEAPPKK